ncbi:hypothetical protein BLNAU_21920 [Blattamonas nauphoetae]|uniref:Uncharacterized protein n=1 Tax=Blattamonas nauphoetae TaxID=2049346 RepID=A0ABQ9WWU5_9EUKA|nr:hypothetical protein BLNAU_21920 [Blattamonas nauphoetae]
MDQDRLAKFGLNENFNRKRVFIFHMHMVVGYLENERESVLRKLAADERSQKEMSERKIQIPSAEETKVINRTRSENKETGEDVKLVRIHTRILFYPTIPEEPLPYRIRQTQDLALSVDCDSECSSYFDVCGSMPGEVRQRCSSSTDHSVCVSCLTGCIQQCVPEREDCLIQCESESISNKGTNACLNAYKQIAEKCLALSSLECIDECSHARSESQDVNQ